MYICVLLATTHVVNKDYQKQDYPRVKLCSALRGQKDTQTHGQTRLKQ